MCEKVQSRYTYGGGGGAGHGHRKIKCAMCIFLFVYVFIVTFGVAIIFSHLNSSSFCVGRFYVWWLLPNMNGFSRKNVLLLINSKNELIS